jgi:hypothetical protein
LNWIVLAFDHFGKSNVLSHVVKTDSDPFTDLGIGDDHDVPSVDFRDAITLLAQTLDPNLTHFAL